MKKYIKILEENIKYWTEDEDWWYGLDDCDINVHSLWEDKVYIVDIYGLTPTDNGLYETNTGNLIDSFIIKGLIKSL